jgi:peroxiredoxin (alkyl hydroperoxide reductase subunit C)
MSKVGTKFPDIAVKTINSDGDELNLNLSKPRRSTLLFWYPKDFTFVCPTELHAFQEKLEEFNKRGYQVFGASCDSLEVHFAWLNTPKDDGGIEGVEYPLISDSRRTLATKLGILDYETEFYYNEKDPDDDVKVVKNGDNVTYRATYLIDKDGMVWHESVNDMPVGRNVDEYLRLIDAKNHVDKHGEVCPANWQEGEDAMDATRQGVKEYLSK